MTEHRDGGIAGIRRLAALHATTPSGLVADVMADWIERTTYRPGENE